MADNKEVIKTGDFELDTRAGYYRYERNKAYHDKTVKTTWSEDFHKFLLSQDIPEQYVSKVSYYADEHGHSAGEEEILNYAYGLIEIFK